MRTSQLRGNKFRLSNDSFDDLVAALGYTEDSYFNALRFNHAEVRARLKALAVTP